MAFIALYIKTNTFFGKSKPKKLNNLNLSKETDLEITDIRQISVISIKSEENFVKNTIDSENEEITDKNISIAWIGLTLRVPKGLFSKEKIILRELNGFIEFGTLNALMGPSGAGKTSLLNCINGRNKAYLTDETQIYLSQFELIRTCFISQDVSQHLIKGLTAKQALIYASKLKNSDQEIDHENSVKNLMNELLISDIGDTSVENCSGGEQKRLVMAMELTSHIKPNLLCIDEPTSGLDSNAAEEVRII
jgi:ABC-type multidrug transport system ATPase subunit